MRNSNDPVGSRENVFLRAHDQLVAGVDSPEFASLNLSAADKATILADNAALHRDHSASDIAKAVARQTTKTKRSTFKRGEANYRGIRQRMLSSTTYTVSAGLKLGLEHPTGVAPGSTASTGPQPVLRAKQLTGSRVQLKGTKGKADSLDLYGKRVGDADFICLGRVTYFPYVDQRPLRVPGQPEQREYYAVLVSHDQPYGTASGIITVTASP